LGDKDNIVVGELLQQEIVEIVDCMELKDFKFGVDDEILECVKDDSKSLSPWITMTRPQ
jgi:hypothetical protein